MFALNNVTAPMDAFPDPSHMNAFCPCYDKQALAVIFTSTRPFSVQEVATVMSGAKRAAADHGVSLSFYEDTTLDGSGLANFFVDLSLSKFHGTVITNIPSPKLPSTGPIQVSLSTYPNITVSPVSDGEEYLGSFKNILPYIGPNNTMTGIEAAKRVIMQDGWTNLVLCINPFQGLYAKYDAICVGAASAVPTGSGRIEVFTAFNVDQVATARASLLERINQEPYPTAIIAPESTISDILFGSGSADLTAEIQRKNISVVAVGISENAVAAMKRGIVAHIIDNGEYLQGYLAVVQAYLFSLQRARLANSVILSGPTVYSRSTLDASGHLDAFYAHAAAHIAGFETTHANGYTFTVATHASAASAFWAGMRSGSQWSAVNTNSTVIEMVTLSTDAATQAAFIRNVSIHNDPVKSDGWTVSLSRWAAFVPQLIEADKRNIPIVGVNTWGNYDVTSTNLSRIMAFVAFDEYTAMHQLTKFLLGKNPGATQGICMDENAEDPTTASCAAFVDIAKEKGINFTYLNLPENSAAATLLIDKALAWFPPSAKFVIVDRIGKCWIHASLRKAKFSIGTGGQAVVGTFDSDPCVVDGKSRER
ncbi:hypothetical protein DFJ73DRAFT_540240 [Zopfochytrium polystomum]|nr:hypothetical protein DFJ73DRAFT_540240 [Zopfochytrium polystomum]